MATTKRKSRSKAVQTSNGPDLATVGRYIFLGGLVIAIIAGLFFAVPSLMVQAWQLPVVYLLIALALVGGFLHISKESENSFLLIALAVYFFSDRLGYIPVVGSYLTSMLGVVGVFLSIAALAVVARKVVGWFQN